MQLEEFVRAMMKVGPKGALATQISVISRNQVPCSRRPPARRPHPCAPRSPRSVERSKWWLDQRPLRAAPDSRRLSARPALPPLAACRLPPALLPLAQPLWLTSCVACPAPTGLKRLIITLIHTHVSAQAVLSFFAVQSGEMAAEPPRLTFAVVEGGSGGFAVRSAQHTSSGSWP